MSDYQTPQKDGKVDKSLVTIPSPIEAKHGGFGEVWEVCGS